jgi:hypothetical protein
VSDQVSHPYKTTAKMIVLYHYTVCAGISKSVREQPYILWPLSVSRPKEQWRNDICK